MVHDHRPRLAQQNPAGVVLRQGGQVHGEGDVAAAGEITQSEQPGRLLGEWGGGVVLVLEVVIAAPFLR